MKKFIAIAAISALLIGCQAPVDSENKAVERVREEVVFKDFGGNPLVINIEDYTLENETFRTAIWTGEYLQLTVMSIPVGGEVGLEVHHDIEQFLRVESGEAQVLMGDSKDNKVVETDKSIDTQSPNVTPRRGRKPATTTK